jgi:tetratricopeptide (TPR) repeat protein
MAEAGSEAAAEPGRAGCPDPRRSPHETRVPAGREDALGRLDLLVASPRRAGADGDAPSSRALPSVCVVSGVAGVGKTSLVLHWARLARDRFPDGLLYADLRGFGADGPQPAVRVLDRFLRELGVPDASVPGDPADKARMYRRLLADRAVLVVLDNAACAAQVHPLLPVDGRGAALVTSRGALGGIEHARYLILDVLAPGDAVAVLRDALGPARADDEAQLAALAAACARLPLALHLAAGRAAGEPLTPLGELVAGLREAAAQACAPLEHACETEAAHTVFGWAYLALPIPVRRLLRQLALHPGPDFGDGAASALAGLTVAQTLPLLDVLIAARLVERLEPERYRMHDLVCAFARERAEYEDSADQIGTVRRRVLNWYLHASLRASQYTDLDCHHPVDLGYTAVARELPEIADPAAAVAWYEREWANLVCAVGGAAEHGLPDVVWQLAATLRFPQLRADRREAGLAVHRVALGHARRQRNRHAEAVALDSITLALLEHGRAPGTEENNLAAIALWHLQGNRLREALARLTLVRILMSRRDWPHAIPLAWEIVATAELLGDKRLEAAALGAAAECYVEARRFEEARLLLHEAVAIHRAHPWAAGLADALWNTSRVLRAVGRPAAALGPAGDAVAVARRTADGARHSRTLLELAVVWQANGHAARALAGFQRATARARLGGDRTGEARALDAVAAFHRDHGDLNAAYAFHERSIAIAREQEDRWILASGLDACACTLDRLAQEASARRYRREAYILFEEFDEPAAHHARGRLSAALDPTPRPTLEQTDRHTVRDGGPDGVDEVRTAR